MQKHSIITPISKYFIDPKLTSYRRTSHPRPRQHRRHPRGHLPLRLLPPQAHRARLQNDAQRLLRHSPTSLPPRHRPAPLSPRRQRRRYRARPQTHPLRRLAALRQACLLLRPLDHARPHGHHGIPSSRRGHARAVAGPLGSRARAMGSLQPVFFFLWLQLRLQRPRKCQG